ncbi:uncharacterized protein ACRADG_002446 isoform 4-T4 [Cochliomyia hominivorax]
MNYQKDFDYEMWLNPREDSIYSFYTGIKDPNLERHSSKGKSRHFPVNGLSSVNSAANNDTRNIYNNPYTSTSLQQQQQQQQQQLRHQQLHQQQQQQLPQHVYKSIAGSSSIGGNSNQYDYSTPNLTTDQQASSASGLVAGVSSNNTTEAENLFLNHNNDSSLSLVQLRFIN